MEQEYRLTENEKRLEKLESSIESINEKVNRLTTENAVACEQYQTIIKELTQLSKDMAKVVNMSSEVNKLPNLERRLIELESRPAKRWVTIENGILVAIASSIGAIIMGFLKS